MRFLIAVQGSYGDVNPCIEIALELRRRGHQVFFITSDFYAPLMNRLGFDFRSILSREEHLRITSHPDFNHRFKCYRFATRELVLGLMRPEYRAIADCYEPGRTAVLTLGLPLGARIAHERLGVPLVTMAHFPQWMQSIREPFGITGPRRLPLAVRKVVRAAFAWRLKSLAAPEGNRFRAELGLPPVPLSFEQWVYSPQLILGLFPAWYARPQPDWPPHVQLTGFPISDHSGEEELGPEVEEFLQAGDPPLVINALSAFHGAREFFEISIAAALRMRKRAILLSQFPHNVPPDLPAGFRHFRYLPHGPLLPRAAGIVHQGGIGTTAKTIRAGIPQVIVPVNFDQPYNGMCVARLGVGAMLPLRRYRPDHLVETMGTLLDSASVAESCRYYAEKIRGQNGVRDACQAIEDLLFPERQAGTLG